MAKKFIPITFKDNKSIPENATQNQCTCHTNDCCCNEQHKDADAYVDDNDVELRNYEKEGTNPSNQSGTNNMPIDSKYIDELGINKAREIINKFDTNSNSTVRSYNVGCSDYSKHKIQPWDIWEEYKLNPWDADIIKRVLRTKPSTNKTELQSRIEDYQKIIHVCQERIRQLTQPKS